MFVNDDSSSDDDAPYDEDDAGRDLTLGRSDHDYEDLTPSIYGQGARAERRLRTTRAKERQPLDDDDEEDDHDDDDEDDSEFGTAFDRKLVTGSGASYPPAVLDEEDDDDDSSDDEPVEIRPRRIS